MTSIEVLWSALDASGEVGGARRIDPEHGCDLYAALDAAGRPGLVLVSGTRPPEPAPFEAVEVTVIQRADGRWSLGIWLRLAALRDQFARLCQELIDASRCIAPPAAAGFLLSQLLRWRRLLEAGSGTMLGTTELRGLIGELLVLRHCLDHWPAAEVVAAWVGPLDAPQDFVLPALRIEVKAIRPGARTTRISSVDQLDVTDARLLLAVVTLATIGPGAPGLSPANLVDEIQDRLERAAGAGAALDFGSRLAAGGYVAQAGYEQPMFRAEAIRFFEVSDRFPRLRRVDLPAGVAEASYDIELGPCVPFEIELGR